MSRQPLYPLTSLVFHAHSSRRIAATLLWLGLGQLGIWLYSCLQDFYGGTRMLLLPVYAGRKFGAAHPQIHQMLASPAGYFWIRNRGELFYPTTSLWDYLLFYTAGGFTILDALFLAGLGCFLYRVLRRLPAGPEFTPALSQVIGSSGLAFFSMYVLKMMFSTYATEVFKAKTQGLFELTHPASNYLYLVAGLLLTLCAGLFRRPAVATGG